MGTRMAFRADERVWVWVRVGACERRHGASINARDKQGFTPLHRALRTGSTNTAIELIGRKAADLEAGTACSGVCTRTVHTSAPPRLPAALASLPADMVVLGNLGICVLVEDAGGSTPLHRACQSNSHKHTVAALLRQKVNVHARNKRRWTPLHACARYGHVAGARRLLDIGAKLDVGDDEGYTPLHRSVMFAHQGIMELLVERHAPLSAVTAGTHRPTRQNCAVATTSHGSTDAGICVFACLPVDNETVWDVARRHAPQLLAWLTAHAEGESETNGTCSQ